MTVFTVGILFTLAVLIGIFAVVFGGTLFLSLPLFQILFPEMSIGALIGNIKIGSILRNATALLPLKNQLDSRIGTLAAVLCVGSVIGAFGVADAPQTYIPLILFFGWLITESAGRLKISTSLFWIGAFLVGVYGGVFGAGIMLLIISLLTLRYSTILNARATALLLEMVLSSVAVVVFLHFDLIVWEIALVWTTGGMIGGYFGGRLIRYTGRLSVKAQRWLIRSAFLIALMVSLIGILK